MLHTKTLVDGVKNSFWRRTNKRWVGNEVCVVSLPDEDLSSEEMGLLKCDDADVCWRGTSAARDKIKM